MSRCEIYAADPHGDVHWYGEARNAHGGAIFIWRKLAEKYRVPFNLFRDDGLDLLWRSVDRMTVDDQIVMRSTFDNVVVRNEELPALIHALERFERMYPSPTLDEEIIVLRRANTDPEVIAVCFNQTSVNGDSLWEGDYDEENDTSTPYNIRRDDRHWLLPIPEHGIPSRTDA